MNGQPQATKNSSCPKSNGNLPNSGVYLNRKLGFSFVVPPGYRLATDLMEFLNDRSANPIPNWSLDYTQAVVITASTDADERAFVQGAASDTRKIDFNTVTSLPRSIYIVGMSLDEKTVENGLTLPHQRTSISGLNAISYTNLSNESVSVVPYAGHPEVNSGDSVGTIFIKMSNATSSFDAKAFNTVTVSFCYLES